MAGLDLDLTGWLLSVYCDEYWGSSENRFWFYPLYLPGRYTPIYFCHLQVALRTLPAQLAKLFVTKLVKGENHAALAMGTKTLADLEVNVSTLKPICLKWALLKITEIAQKLSKYKKKNLWRGNSPLIAVMYMLIFFGKKFPAVKIFNLRVLFTGLFYIRFGHFWNNNKENWKNKYKWRKKN